MQLLEEPLIKESQDNLSLTNLYDYDLRLLQPKDGYRFSVDSLLLARFARIKKRAKIIEFGAGVGVVSLIIARLYPEASITAIEIQEQLYEIAKKNVFLNQIENVSILHLDIKEVDKVFKAGSFDHVITNPPFRPADTGRLCLNSQEALCRHEILITLPELLGSAKWLLKPGGRFFVIYPAERLSYLLTSMSKKGIEPKRLQCVYPKKEVPARMVLVEGVKDAGIEIRVEPSIFVNN